MVKSLSEVCRLNLQPRILGIDDAPFQTNPRARGSEVHAVGIVTSRDRFEGMLYCGGIQQDGLNAGARLAEMVGRSKFLAQVHAVFLDGVMMGGLNVVDIQELATAVGRPVVAVMRHPPDLQRMLVAVKKVGEAGVREERIRAAGRVYEIREWVFQFRCPVVDGAAGREVVTADEVAMVLDRCKPEGAQQIPECLRMAHLIGAAIKTGQSSSSA